MKSTTALALAALLATTSLAAATPSTAQTLLAGERAAPITAIPGVISADAKWQSVWASFMTADGINGTPDGGLLFAQEQSDTIRKIDGEGHESIYLTDTHGTGAISVDAHGRIYGVERTCTDPGKPFNQSCEELTSVVQFAPERRLLANSFKDGKTLGRLNDIEADGKGGAFFTSGGLYYVSAEGVVSVVEDKDLRSNGLMLSLDGRTIFVTNNDSVLAFDVLPDGSTRNRRTFATLNGDNGGDGMAIDSVGRLYVTGAKGVHVIGPDGKYLGLIPTPRRAITLAFSGPDKKTLYAGLMGVVGPDGKDWVTPKGVRNVAMTLYRIDMLSEGFKGRPK